jgi:hypothetical protein
MNTPPTPKRDQCPIDFARYILKEMQPKLSASMPGFCQGRDFGSARGREEFVVL